MVLAPVLTLAEVGLSATLTPAVSTTSIEVEAAVPGSALSSTAGGATHGPAGGASGGIEDDPARTNGSLNLPWRPGDPPVRSAQ